MREKAFKGFGEYDIKYDTLFSIKPIEEKYFDDWKEDMPFFMNIAREGITLWSKNAA